MVELMHTLLADQQRMDARIAAHTVAATTLAERCFEALVGPKPSMTTGAVLPPKPVDAAPTPQEGAYVIQCSLGDADCWIEFDVIPEDGDGWNEPHTPEEIQILGALINGVWVSPDEFAASTVERWHQAAVDFIADLRDAAEAEREEHYAAERELRRSEL